jgi:hypothetical protein
MDEMERNRMRVIRIGGHRRSKLFEISIQMHLHTRPVIVIYLVILDGRDIMFRGPSTQSGCRGDEVHRIASKSGLQMDVSHKFSGRR